MTQKILLVIFAYLLGSLSPSYLITKWKTKKDIRKIGSKNPGAANTFRNAGKFWGILVGFLDALKGVIPVYLAKDVLGMPDYMIIAAGCAVIIGHNWSCFLKFYGGKGVASFIGIGLYIAPRLMAIAFPAAVIFGYISKYIPGWKKLVPPMHSGTILGAILLLVFTYQSNMMTEFWLVLSIGLIMGIRQVITIIRLLKEKLG